MTDRLQTLQDDISFLRDLAEGDGSPRLLGGSILVAAGSIYGAASLAHGVVAAGLLPGASPWAPAWIWSGATVAFFGVLFILLRRMGRQPVGIAARAAGLAWSAVGWTIFAVFVCLQIVVWRTHSLAPLMLAPSLILSLYGMAWTIAAGVTRQAWIWRVAAGSYVAAIAVAVVCLSPWAFVVYAAALVAVAVAPGIVLMRHARGA